MCTRCMSRKHSCETALLVWKRKICYKTGTQGVSLLFQRLWEPEGLGLRAKEMPARGGVVTPGKLQRWFLRARGVITWHGCDWEGKEAGLEH